ncbi:MAG: hypothetical protein GXO45_03670 [Aquificae bacterium]|nr:hypothetical protein [Aquificota bacterium]
MRRVIPLLLTVITATAQDLFYNGENTVGHIKDTDGNSYIVVETPDGKAKLIKTNKKIEKVIPERGITKQDFKEAIGEGR